MINGKNHHTHKVRMRMCWQSFLVQTILCPNAPMPHPRAWGTQLLQCTQSLRPTERFLQNPRAFKESPKCKEFFCNVILFSSGRKQQRSNSQHTFNSSEFRKYKALGRDQHVFCYLQNEPHKQEDRACRGLLPRVCSGNSPGLCQNYWRELNF